MDPMEIIRRLTEDDATPPTDQELAAARAEFQELLDDVTSPDNDDPDIELGRDLRDSIATIDAEVERRAEVTAARRAEADELRSGVFDSDTDDDEDDDEDGVADDDDATTASTGQDLMTRLRARAQSARARAAEPPYQPPSEPDVLVRTIGPAGGDDLGDNPTLASVADVFAQYAPTISRPGQSSPLIRLDKRFPEGRRLTNSATENTRLLDAVTSPRAVTAAGGICDPLDADHTHPICGDRSRPIRDGLPSFAATRGGLRFAPAMSIGEFTTAITEWTEATDASPGGSVKACPQVDCDAELEAKVDAIVACLTVGNFQAKFNPEAWQAALDLLMVEHDRVAEQALLTSIDAESTNVTGQTIDGTVVNVLVNLDKAAAGLRSRHRLNQSTALRAILPTWVRDALRSHLARQAPHGTTDQYTVADATLSSFFTSRNITPIWTPDDDVFGPQTNGAILDWPGGDVDIRLFPEGTWVFFDGGTLDLGTEIRDSQLNATNDRQAFMETFEQAVFRGCESLNITVPVDELCICSEGASI